MRGDAYTPRHKAPETSWWAEPMSYEAWTVRQQLKQQRMSATGVWTAAL